MLLQDHCEAVLHASTRDEFQRVLVRFAQDLGFGIMAAAAVYDRPGSRPEFVIAHNTPQSYLDIFESDAGARDPVMQHCKFSGLPIVWDQATYVCAGRAELWEELAAHGYQTGISMALHLPQGRHFVFGVDGDQPLPKKERLLARMVADLASVLMFAQDAAFYFLPSHEGDSRGLDQQAAMAESLSGPPIAKPNDLARSKGLVLPSWLRMDDDPLGFKRTNGISNFKARLPRLIH